MNIKIILSYLLLSVSIGALLFSPSCANTSTPPSGGPKDTLPPVLVGTMPPYNSINFSAKRIEVKFNEYVKLNDVVNQIFFSPPQAKRPQAMVRGKSVVVTPSAPLDTNTTYTLYFGQSIVDNNEGNPFGAYSFSFSTGSVLDTLLFSGYAVDARTLLPLDNISIMLHTQDADTTIYKTLPRAMAKTDLWGYFAVLNLKDIPYRVFAVEDLNKNNRYDDNNEMIGFFDSLFIPQTVMVVDSFAMSRIDPKDTLSMLARPIERTLYLFKERPKRQILREKMRPQSRHFYFTFSAPYVQIDSLEIDEIDPLSLICEYTFLRDTVRYWLRGAHVPDTLKGMIYYLKTDSLNQLSPVEERFSLALPKQNQAQEAPSRGKVQSGVKIDTVRTDTDVLKIDLTAKAEYVEQTGIVFSFSAYPIEFDLEKISFSYQTARDEEIKVPFSFQKDSLNGCLYSLIPEKWTPAVSYNLYIPQGIFTDVYGFKNDSLVQKITLPDADKLGSISVTLLGGNGTYIVELLSENRERVIRTLQLPAEGKGVFPYLPDAMYVIRITEDKNGNGVWDTGNLDQRIQPERVRFYKFANGVETIEIKDQRELEQTIDIEELFDYDVAPIVPAKTKK